MLGGFAQIGAGWEWFAARLKALQLPGWSHHLWPVLIHDVINMTAAVRFKAGMRIGLARHVFERVRLLMRVVVRDDRCVMSSDELVSGAVGSGGA